jgi:sporulation protein YlmC with PRC-barrel domain
MNKLAIAVLFSAGMLSVFDKAEAQVAGSTKVGVSVTELRQVALGWSVKKSILDKEVYNEVGEKIGNVEDLIIAPDKKVSYLIVGAGGFLGIGRHDVAFPVTQVQDLGAKLVIPGATKDAVKAMPRFDYDHDMEARNQFVASAEQDIVKAKAKVAGIEKEAAAANANTKAKLQQQVTEMKKLLKVAEEKLSELKRATANRWKDLERDVSAAVARLRESA